LDLYDGETLVIMGKSGSGKSVMIKCLIGLEKPDSGSIVRHG
jgi:phospholipid/cholesterol/gamma-HCH transport system ATP-binding protein